VQAGGNTDALRGEPPFPQKVLKVKEKVEAVATTALVPEEQMEREILAVWNYYLNASDREETLIPSKKKMGLAILRELHAKGGGCARYPVYLMACAIDAACHVAKRNKKKAYLSKWTSIFSKFETFWSLADETNSGEIYQAAELEAEWKPPKPVEPAKPQKSAEEIATETCWRAAIKERRRRFPDYRGLSAEISIEADFRNFLSGDASKIPQLQEMTPDLIDSILSVETRDRMEKETGERF